jgi:hypothetical protein
MILYRNVICVIVVDSQHQGHPELLAQHSCHQQDPLAEILLLASALGQQIHSRAPGRCR